MSFFLCVLVLHIAIMLYIIIIIFCSHYIKKFVLCIYAYARIECIRIFIYYEFYKLCAENFAINKYFLNDFTFFGLKLAKQALPKKNLQNKHYQKNYS